MYGSAQLDKNMRTASRGQQQTLSLSLSLSLSGQSFALFVTQRTNASEQKATN